MSKIVNITPVENVEFVAVRTKSGYYKTRAGMSHNCDDL